MGKNIKKIIKIIYESLVSIIYPIENYCILCKRNDYVGICDICRSKITCIKNNDNDKKIINIRLFFLLIYSFIATIRLLKIKILFNESNFVYWY